MIRLIETYHTDRDGNCLDDVYDYSCSLCIAAASAEEMSAGGGLIARVEKGCFIDHCYVLLIWAILLNSEH